MLPAPSSKSLLIILIVVGVVNAVLFTIVACAIGGEALSGRVTDEGYFLMQKGVHSRVNPLVYYLSYAHTVSLWITSLMACVAGFLLLHSNHLSRPHRNNSRPHEEQLSAGVTQATDAQGRIVLTIPALRSIAFVILLSLAILIAVICGVAVFGLLDFRITDMNLGAAKDSIIILIFFAAWGAIWFACVAWLLFIWLWNVKGYEQVILSVDSLELHRVIPGWRRVRRYPLRSISNLRVLPESHYWWDPHRLTVPYFMLSKGLLAFDYEGRSICFGQGLTQTAAQDCLEVIRRNMR
jgi:hypothetical protein